VKKLYAALAIPGFLLPMSQLLPFIRQSGFDLMAFMTQPFVNPASSMFALDLLVSCVVFWTFVFFEGQVRHRWLYVALTLLVGLSFALPLFLWARETPQAPAFAAAA
jgi:hypothetical protein